MKQPKTHLQFICEHDGVLEREDVDVWCNRCDREKTVYKDGLYLCPECLNYKEGNFTCRICGGKKVNLVAYKEKDEPIQTVNHNG
jgi:Zn finger protein HypA/HybF involved in hydrogenase expression